MDSERALEIAREKKPDPSRSVCSRRKMTGPDVLKAFKKDPATAGIAVVMFTGLSQKNAARLQPDGACAFLEKSQLGLDQGSRDPAPRAREHRAQLESRCPRTVRITAKGPRGPARPPELSRDNSYASREPYS
jgi:hypothetical protein